MQADPPVLAIQSHVKYDGQPRAHAKLFYYALVSSQMIHPVHSISRLSHLNSLVMHLHECRYNFGPRNSYRLCGKRYLGPWRKTQSFGGSLVEVDPARAA
jgi:hypothetical protein